MNEKPVISGEQMARRQEWTQGRLLGDEGLRSELADDEAQVLIDWGLAQANAQVALTAGITDDEEAKNALRESLRPVSTMMRGINRFAGDKDSLDVETAQRQLGALFTQVSPNVQLSAVRAACNAVAREKNELSNLELVQRLVAIADKVMPRQACSSSGGAAGRLSQPPAPQAGQEPKKRRLWDSVLGIFGRR